MLVIGSKQFAYSYIVLANGTKIYLTESKYEMNEIFRTKKEMLQFHVAGLIETKEINIKKVAIVYYGEV